MASIRSAIELQDNFTGILMQVINAVNMSVSTMEQMQSVMNEPVDTSALQGMRDQLAQATLAARELDAALQNIDPPADEASRVSSVRLPAPPSSAEWQSFEGLDVFANTGMERAKQEIAGVNAMLGQLSDTQYCITQQSNEAEILSPQAAYDVQMVENRLQDLKEMIEQVENNPLNLGTDSANAGFERLRGQLDALIQQQKELDKVMQGTDTEAVNAVYLQFSENINDIQRFVRDSFSNIPPVEIPVTWSSDSLETFTGTGMERFQQEAASANAMLNTLNRTQEQIAARAAQTDLFPPGMVTDLDEMQNRLQAIQERIQTIESNPLNMGANTANEELERLRSQLDQAVQVQERMSQAVENMDVQSANEAYLRLSQIIGGTERYIRDNVDEQGRFNREIAQGTDEADRLMQTIGGAVAVYASFQSLSGVLQMSDQMTATTARLNLMNDGLQTTEDLQNMIYLSAERSRGSYQATADAVAKMGLMAGDAFSSSEEIIAFMEQVNKQFRIAGTETAGIDAAMLQLTQAMGSGVLRGEEYNSILEQAPNIIQAIADYLGVSKGELKDMAAEGQISAEIVKAALFAVADETNEKFESMPRTFEQIGTSFQNAALMAFQPVLERLNEIANSEAFQQLVNGAVEMLTVAAGMTLNIFDLLSAGAGILEENWSWISPIVYGVAGALAVYYGWLLLTKGAALAAAAAQGALTFAKMLAVPVYAALSGATMADTAAQWGLNSAMYACPIVWIIILIIALIALFYAAVAAVNHFAGTSVSATGLICGGIATAAAFIGNLLVALINFGIDLFAVFWNFIAAFANFLGNVFSDPVGAIARLFFDLVDGILSLLQSLASAIDTIFGTELAGAVSGWRDSLTGWVDDTFGQGEEIMEKIDPTVWHKERFEYGEAWDAGYSFGEGIDESIANFDPGSFFGNDIPQPEDYTDVSGYDAGMTGIGNGVDDIAANTGAMADAMDISGEELKYLRDLAEQESVNRFTTAEIHLEQTNYNTIQKDMDLDGVVSNLTGLMEEAIDISAEGVHE